LFLFGIQIVAWFSIIPQFNMDRANAEEFLEVYKGVVAEYTVSICCFSLSTMISRIWLTLYYMSLNTM